MFKALALAALLAAGGCAGTASGDVLDRLAGVHQVKNPDGSISYVKDPGSPVESAGGMFGPLGALIGTLLAGGIYGIRKLGESVPKDAHLEALKKGPAA